MYRTYAIPAAFGGSCVRDFLRNGLHFPNRMISRLKVRQEGILLNGAHVTVRAVLSCADRLDLLISDPVRYDPASRSVWHAPVPPAAGAPILYEDPDLLFFAKPAGAVMHPSHGHYADTMANAVASHLGILRGRVYPIGRLDRDTTGVVCFAKHEDACSLLAEEQKKHIVQKTYLAEVLGRIACDGSVNRPIGIVESDLAIVRAFGETPDASADDERKTRTSGSHITPRRAVMEEADGGQPAGTIYHVLGWRMHDGSVLCAGKETDVPIDADVVSTLLSVRIIHGRTHQIRVHMAYIGHPLTGDVLYGGAAVPDLHLHAYRMELLQPFTGERLSIGAPAPDWAAC